MLFFEKINNTLHALVWGPGMLALLMLAGIYFSVGTRFFQITRFKLWMNETIISVFKRKDCMRSNDSKAISQFQSLSTALAGTMGTGNIIGVATAIAAGGAGAIFWMWIAALVGMIIKFAENVLGIVYRRRNAKGEWEGGPMIYIERGLHNRPLAICFSVLCVIASFGVGNIAQVNAIASCAQDSFSASKLITGIITAAAVALVMAGGLKRIARVSEILVPFISVLYIAGCFVIIGINFKNIGTAFEEIFTSAFGIRQALGGSAGYAMTTALRYGVSRGIFSNEAGMGSSVIVHSTADVDHPVKQGMWGIFEVFADTIVVCTLTALAILVTGAHRCVSAQVSTITAFESVFGRFGSVFIAVSVFLFAFASLIGWSFYGWRGLSYITHERGEKIYRALFVLAAAFGGVAELETVMTFSDSINGLMCIPNMIALIFLSKAVFEQTKDYNLKNIHNFFQKN